METFSAVLALCAGNSPVTGAQRLVTQSFGVTLNCVWIKSWVNNREAGDLRLSRSLWRHCDVHHMPDQRCSQTVIINDMMQNCQQYRYKLPTSSPNEPHIDFINNAGIASLNKSCCCNVTASMPYYCIVHRNPRYSNWVRITKHPTKCRNDNACLKYYRHL